MQLTQVAWDFGRPRKSVWMQWHVWGVDFGPPGKGFALNGLFWFGFWFSQEKGLHQPRLRVITSHGTLKAIKRRAGDPVARNGSNRESLCERNVAQPCVRAKDSTTGRASKSRANREQTARRLRAHREHIASTSRAYREHIASISRANATD